MSDAIYQCNICPKKDFRPISPEPGLLIGICSDHIAEYAGINCTLCGHHHHHPDNQPACQEFHVLLTADENEVIEWDAVVAVPVQWQMPTVPGSAVPGSAVPGSAVPGTATHVITPPVPAYDYYEDIPCPGCGGRYDGEDYGGRGCSRVCAYGEPEDY